MTARPATALRTLALGVALLLLAACAAKPTQPPEPPPAPPVAETKPPEPKGPPPGSAAAKQQAQQLVRSASEALNEGDEERARNDLQLARELDPDNRTVACLQKGLTVDPQATLGRDSTAYVVRPGETMGRIAQRALGDVCEFYLLARYNGLRVPKQLAAGQTIRVPGKTPLAPPVAEPRATPAAPTARSAPPPPEPPPGTADGAREAAPPPAPSPPPPLAEPAAPTAPAATPAVVTSPSRSGAAIDAAAAKSAVEMHARAAQAAFRRQDLATAIREWDTVLALDPGNELARVKRQEAVELDRRAKQLK
jgi:LysM repeat protein